MRHSAVFLDRDGVINQDTGYVGHIEQVAFLPGVFEACRALQQAGFVLVIVTNQPGIALGRYSENDFDHTSAWMMQQFEQYGVRAPALYYCPHHPDVDMLPPEAGCDCRKPAPGMLLRAGEELSLDLSSSIMVGDRDTDMLAAERAGLALGVRVASDHVHDPNAVTHMAVLEAASLSDFVQRYLYSK